MILKYVFQKHNTHLSELYKWLDSRTQKYPGITFVYIYMGFTIDAIKTSNKTFCMTTPPPPSPSIFHIIALYYRQGISHIPQKRSNIKNNATKLLNMHSLVIIYHTWFVITIRCLDRKRLVFRAVDTDSKLQVEIPCIAHTAMERLELHLSRPKHYG